MILVHCLENAYDPIEIEPLFTPGFVRQHIDDVLWERTHGAPKRTLADPLVGEAVYVDQAQSAIAFRRLA